MAAREQKQIVVLTTLQEMETQQKNQQKTKTKKVYSKKIRVLV